MMRHHVVDEKDETNQDLSKMNKDSTPDKVYEEKVVIKKKSTPKKSKKKDETTGPK